MLFDIPEEVFSEYLNSYYEGRGYNKEEQARLFREVLQVPNWAYLQEHGASIVGGSEVSAESFKGRGTVNLCGCYGGRHVLPYEDGVFYDPTPPYGVMNWEEFKAKYLDAGWTIEAIIPKEDL
jgi:hypothetical protein